MPLTAEQNQLIQDLAVAKFVAQIQKNDPEVTFVTFAAIQKFAQQHITEKYPSLTDEEASCYVYLTAVHIDDILVALDANPHITELEVFGFMCTVFEADRLKNYFITSNTITTLYCSFYSIISHPSQKYPMRFEAEINRYVEGATSKEYYPSTKAAVTELLEPVLTDTQSEAEHSEDSRSESAYNASDEGSITEPSSKRRRVKLVL